MCPGLCWPYCQPPLTPSPIPVISEPTCSVVHSVMYVSLFSLWQLFCPPSPRLPHSQIPVQAMVRPPQNVAKKSPSVLWVASLRNFPLEGKAGGVEGGDARGFPACLSKVVLTLPWLWCRHFKQCFICSLVCLVVSVLPGKFVFLAQVDILMNCLPLSSPQWDSDLQRCRLGTSGQKR